MKKRVVDYSILSLIGLGFKEFFSFLKNVLKSGGESDLLRELNVKKGFVASIKYSIFLGFVLIPKILKFAVNPTKNFKRNVEKLTNNVVAFFALREEDYISKTYSKFVEQLLQNANVTLKANIEDVNKFINLYIARNVLNIIVFAVILIITEELATMFLISVFQNIGFASAMAGFVGMAGSLDVVSGEIQSSGSTLLAVFGSLVFLFAGVVGVSAIGYLTFFILKLMYFEFVNITKINEDELNEFLDELIVFNYLKTKELYGDEIATNALTALKQNFVLNNNELEKIEYLNVKKIEKKA